MWELLELCARTAQKVDDVSWMMLDDGCFFWGGYLIQKWNPEAPRVLNWCFEDPLPHWSRSLVSERNRHIHHLQTNSNTKYFFVLTLTTWFKLLQLRHLAEDKQLDLGSRQASGGVDCRHLPMLSRTKSNGLPHCMDSIVYHYHWIIYNFLVMDYTCC